MFCYEISVPTNPSRVIRKSQDFAGTSGEKITSNFRIGVPTDLVILYLWLILLAQERPRVGSDVPDDILSETFKISSYNKIKKSYMQKEFGR